MIKIKITSKHYYLHLKMTKEIMTYSKLRKISLGLARLRARIENANIDA